MPDTPKGKGHPDASGREGSGEGGADLVVLLHSHMPYVRRNGDWPVGEQWLLEAWAESYLPVWEIIADLTEGKLRGKLALTLTPVLAEQLKDAYLKDRFQWYLENRIRQAGEEVRRLRDLGERERAGLASHYQRHLSGLLSFFRERLRCDMLKTLREGMEAGVLEVLASAATHAHLPLLGHDRCRRAQVKVGLECYRRDFGRDPRGFWLPECAYTPELDPLLEDLSPRPLYVVLDHDAAGPGGSRPTWMPYRLGTTSLVALLRDPLAHELVWTPEGYPSRGPYREYCKRDHQGHGFQYWSVTSTRTPLEDKDIYDPCRAEGRAAEDASDFAARVSERISAIRRVAGTPSSPSGGESVARPYLLAAYDTELLGHWWFEGPLWLRQVLDRLAPLCALPAEVAERSASGELPVISPPLTAWNVDGTFSTWRNDLTEGMWEETRLSERRFLSLLAEGKGGADPGVVAQAGRELLLLEASDWTFMVTRDTAAAYARDRFRSHLERFRALLGMAGGEGDFDGLLEELEETDNLFPWLHAGFWG